jgi:radical SAM superfamily enzyme YgiQ (UPF0313 family)
VSDAAPRIAVMPAIVLATLNARYTHASLSLRYLRANLGALRQDSAIAEFVIGDDPKQVVEKLLAHAPRIVGFGVYIWNVEETTRIVALLKRVAPEVVVIVGGPEVSYELEEQRICTLSDYVVTGWGDITFAKLCHAVMHGPKPLMKVHAGEQPPMDAIAYPYDEYSDHDLAQRTVYLEASRGCPFKCEFCLSALDKTAWPFALENFLAQLEKLHARGLRQFKFVDRTFNLKAATGVAILEFFLGKMGLLQDQSSPHPRFKPGAGSNPLPLMRERESHRSLNKTSQKNAIANIEEKAPSPASAGEGWGEGLPHAQNAHTSNPLPDPVFLHFEVIPDHLPDALKEPISKFPPGTLQFEIGIQTLNPEVQQRISRKQDNAKALANIAWLVQHSNAHLHVDLIAGLPGETVESFARGFDQLHAAAPHEIQFGILKRLRGTPIIRHTQAHRMVYSPDAPYEVLATDAIDFATMQRLSRFARYWDLVANSGRFAHTLPTLLATHNASAEPSAFASFLAFADWLYASTGKTHQIALERLFEFVHTWLTGSCALAAAQVEELLEQDYAATGAKGRLSWMKKGLSIQSSGDTAKANRAATPPRQARHAA